MSPAPAGGFERVPRKETVLQILHRKGIRATQHVRGVALRGQPEKKFWYLVQDSDPTKPPFIYEEDTWEHLNIGHLLNICRHFTLNPIIFRNATDRP